jgi:signal transduction histidine kinase
MEHTGNTAIKPGIKREKGSGTEGLFNASPEKNLDRFTSLAAGLLEMPMALLVFAEEEWLWLKSCYGMEKISRVERRVSFLTTVFNSGTFTIKEDSQTPFDRSDPLTGEPWGIRFSAAAPIFTKEGEIIGALSAMDKKTGPFSESKIHILCSLADILAEYINAQVALNSQKEAFRRIVHDLKNPLTTISLSAELIQEEENISEDTREMSRQIALASQKMTGMVNRILQ